MRKIYIIVLVITVVSCIFSACSKKTVEPDVKEEEQIEVQEERILYNGDLIAEYEINEVKTQLRFLHGYFYYYKLCDLIDINPVKEDVPKIYDSVESKDCIYTLSDDEKVTITGFRKDLNLKTQEISYWLKVSVDDIEGWFFLYTSTKPNHFFFEDDFWVPYKKAYTVDGVDHDYIIRTMTSVARLRFSATVKTYPDRKAPDAGVISTDPDPFKNENYPTYVSVIGMTVNQDPEADMDYTKTWFLIERDGVTGWVTRGMLDYGEMGGRLFHGPIEEIKNLVQMGA